MTNRINPSATNSRMKTVQSTTLSTNTYDSIHNDNHGPSSSERVLQKHATLKLSSPRTSSSTRSNASRSSGQLETDSYFNSLFRDDDDDDETRDERDEQRSEATGESFDASCRTRRVDNTPKSCCVARNAFFAVDAVDGASHVSEHQEEMPSVSRFQHHDSDILVEIEAFTIEPRNLMIRPGLRCPASLPIPIYTTGVDCVGRVIHSSPHSVLHGIMFRDRVCAIYPFEYERKRVWNKHGTTTACAYVDAGLALPIPKHVDAAEASTLLHVYTPAFQCIQDGILRSTRSRCSNRYNISQLEGKSILIQNGHTELGLALIELALVLGGERVYATGSSVHHSLLEGAGAIPLGLVEKEEDKAWRAWENLREKKEVSLVIMQEMPALSLLEMFLSVLHRDGSIVKMEDPGNCGISETEMLHNRSTDDVYGLIDWVEKARSAHELEALNLRLNSCSQLVTYNGVLANIAKDPLAWKEDVRFLMNLLSGGILKPRVQEQIYRIEDVPEVQERIQRNGKLGPIVCLPSKKQPKVTLTRNATRASSILGDCSLKTKMETDATTKIAAVWRRYACQKGYKCTIRAARRVDALIHQMREDSAKRIQSKWRTCRTKKWYEKAHRNIVRLQYFFRRCIAWSRLVHLRKEKYLRESGASTRIAAVWRRFRCRREFTRCVHDIVVIQSIARRKVGCKKLELLRLEKREACSRRIQSEWKARVERRRINRILLNMRHMKHVERSAAVMIQATWRRNSAIQCFSHYKCNTILLQSRCRMWIARSRYNHVVRDVTLCQSTIRKYLAVKTAKALRHDLRMTCATVIQTRWRGHVAIQRYVQCLYFTILIQSAARSRIVRIQCRQIIEDITVCQSAARRYLAANEANVLRLKRDCAILVQTWWRCCNALQRFTLYRGCAILIQSSVRKWITMRHYLCTVEVAALCQSAARRYLALRKVDAIRSKRRIAHATVVQARWRCCIWTKRLLVCRNSAVVLQSAIRTWAEKKQFKKVLRDIIVCQSFVRRDIAKKKAKALQSHANYWRLAAAESENLLESYKTSKHRHLASMKIQTVYSKYNAQKRRNVSTTGNSSGAEQPKDVVVYPCRREETFQEDVFSVGDFQSNFSCCIPKHDFDKFVSAVVVIQTFLHRENEKKKINVGIKGMNEFEFENIYKGMLNGVDNPTVALKQIIICQSIVRRKIARRKTQEMRKLNNYWHLARAEEENVNTLYHEVKKRHAASTRIQLAYLNYIERMD
ncbi:hypothetical protein ACHAWX_005550 [Stephanocyclus meneghinianus]